MSLGEYGKLPEVPGLNVLDPRKWHSQGPEKSLQLLESLRRRLVVYAVQRWELVATQEACGGHVGRDHALFDHPVGIIVFVGADGLDPAILAELDVGLRKLEIDGAALTTLG